MLTESPNMPCSKHGGPRVNLSPTQFGPTSFPEFFPWKLEWVGKDPGIGWPRAQQTPENLGCNKLATTSNVWVDPDFPGNLMCDINWRFALG